MFNELKNAPFHSGDVVKTEFYPKEKDMPRTVIRCYPSIGCQSGWLVDTENSKGKILNALDAEWYQPAKDNR